MICISIYFSSSQYFLLVYKNTIDKELLFFSFLSFPHQEKIDQQNEEYKNKVESQIEDLVNKRVEQRNTEISDALRRELSNCQSLIVQKVIMIHSIRK